MQIEPIKIYTPPALNLVNWVLENPKKAAQVGATLVAVGGLILVLDAIFNS